MPVLIDAPWAEEPIPAQAPSAENTFEDDAVVGKHQHPARLLVYNLVHPPKDPVIPAAIRHHLDVEPQSTISIVDIKSCQDLLPGLYLHQFAWLKVQDS